MLSFQLLKNHAGILLIGDYTSLKLLHEVVHDVNERSPLVEDKEGPFLGLAYDARKAFERQREVLRPPKHYEEIGVRYGVQILWPVLLLQHRILRASLGYCDHSKRHQAITYALEAVIEDALKSDFGADADALIELWHRIDPAHPAPIARLTSRGALFSAWSKSQRKTLFGVLLESFDPMYDTMYKLRAKGGEKVLISPEEFAKWEDAEWADPHW